MKHSKYCLDTHPIIWYFTGQKTLSKKAKKVIDNIFSGKFDCFISSIVLLEAFHVSLKYKKFNFPKFLDSLRLSNVIAVPLDKVILESCYRLPKQLNIHDRVILATSRVTGSSLVTKDKDLRKFSSAKTIW